MNHSNRSKMQSITHSAKRNEWSHNVHVQKAQKPPPAPASARTSSKGGMAPGSQAEKTCICFRSLGSRTKFDAPETRRRAPEANEAACGAWYTYAENEAALPARLCLTCVVFSFLCSSSAFTQSGMRRYSLATVQPCLIHGHTGSPFGQATRGGRPTPLSRRSRYRPRTSSRRPTRSPGSPSC